MSKQRCKIASKNVNFTIDDNERPLFIDNKSNKTPQEIKTVWTDKVFSGAWIPCAYNETSVLNATIHIEYNDLKQVRNTNYMLVEVHNETKYYFVTKVTIKNDSVATLTLYLDTVTTYLDNITFGNKMLVKRKHFDRYVKGTDGKYHINNDKHSGIWNKEQDIPSPVLIPETVKPINVIDDALSGAWWPMAFMRTKPYGGTYHEYHGTLTDHWSVTRATTTDDFNSNIGGSKIFSNVWNLQGINTNYKLNTYSGEIMTVDYINKTHSADVVKIFALPLPPVAGKSVNVNSHAHTVDIVGDDTEYITLADSKTIYAPSQVDLRYVASYQDKITFPSQVKHVISKDDLLKGFKDPKIHTSNHTRHVISSINGQATELVNEYILGDESLAFRLILALTTEGVVSTCMFSNSFYDKHRLDNSKTFTVSYKDQVPSNSNAYNDYMLANGNSYKTAQANARRSQLTGMASSIFGGIASAAVGLATGGVGLAVVGSAAITAGRGAAGSYVQGKNRLNELKAKGQDLQNLGSTTELDDVSLIKDMTNQIQSGFGDTKLAYSLWTMPEIQQDRVDSYYKKYGYECENLDTVSDYNYFSKRAHYTYFEVASVKTAIDKSSVPVEVLEDLNRVFTEGVRLWNVKEDGTVKVSDYETENWELPIYNELTV